MSDVVDYNEFLAAFGVTPETPPTEVDKTPPADPVKVDETKPQEPTTPEPASTETKPVEEDPKVVTKPVEPVDKAGQAFAQMRTENKKFQTALKGIAEVLGVQDTKNPEEMINTLQALVTKAQAQKQGVPTELLQRLQTLEQRDQEYTSNQTRQAAYIGFQKVKDTFELSDSDLAAFADTLVAENINPFEQVIDLVSEYKLRNFEKIVAAAQAKGAQLEAERALKASTHSTTPSKTQGQANADTEKITSVAELNNWFSKQK